MFCPAFISPHSTRTVLPMLINFGIQVPRGILYKLVYFLTHFLGWPDPAHTTLSETSNTRSLKIGHQLISNSETEKILGVTFDDKLSFKCHVDKICKKASQKLYALFRVSNYMSCHQRKLIMDAFISSHFNYCPLVWMCHSRTLNNQVNRIHHRALSIVYRDYTSSFQTRQTV